MIDLSNNRVPFGLLTKEEKKALKTHTGGWLTYLPNNPVWQPAPHPSWLASTVYRTVSPPKREERFVVWDGDGDICEHHLLEDAQKWMRDYGGTIYHITRNEDGSDPQIEFVE